MLINKLLLEHGYMIIRSSDSKYIRYIMDLDLRPIVYNLDNNEVISLCYINLRFLFCSKETWSLPNIRILTTDEIKLLLRDLTIKIDSSRKIDNILLYPEVLPILIERDKL